MHHVVLVNGIAERRLRSQHLLGNPFRSAVEAVRWLGAVQSQDYAAAKWALAQRTAGATDLELDRFIDEGAILRTHAMRPTWHFVVPEDIRWLLDLTSPRLLSGLAGRYRRLELDQKTLGRAVLLFERSLRGGRFLTRPELGQILTAARISPAGQRIAHLVLYAEAKAIIVNGPRRGKQMTYGLLAERAPTAQTLDRETALAQLTSRYFRSHGPAQITDFAWWSGLTVAEIKQGLALVGSKLERESIDGKEYWSSAESNAGIAPSLIAHLLPNFDEYTVAYRDRSAALHADVAYDPSLFAFYRAAAPGTGIISNVVTIGGMVRGSWRRTIGGKDVRVDVRLLGPLKRTEVAALESVAAEYGRFLERTVDLRISN
jgi:hypothetical protein